MHLKRNKADKKYPIRRKGTKFLVRPSHSFKRGVPILIALREMLKIAKNRKEAKEILNKGQVEVNGKIRKNEKLQIVLFDLLNLKCVNKTYKLTIENNKFLLVETNEKENVGKVVNKRKLKGDKTQINLRGGENFIVKENIKIGDSVVFDSKEKKILKIIPLNEKSKVVTIDGKYIGQDVKILSIDGEIAEVSLQDKKIKINIKNLMAI